MPDRYLLNKNISEDRVRKKQEEEIFNRKLQATTTGLRRFYHRMLVERISRKNAQVIIDYILAMKTETNLSDNYRGALIVALVYLSEFHDNKKSFMKMTRESVLKYLDSFRKPESVDPLHKWIGSYNLYRIFFIRFFKWLYTPELEANKRPNPSVVDNIPRLRRKEISVYKPSDLWTQEDDLLFFKYCPNKRDRCYHAISRDLSCRPHEILNIRIKDTNFKTTAEDYQYAEVVVNGKTGSRPIPLISSIPYVKDWLDDHMQRSNPNAFLVPSKNRKNYGRRMTEVGLYNIYTKYKTEFFPKLLEDPNVPSEDKQRIQELLKKPWNPYIRRHSALTEKSTILKEHVLRQHAGWSGRSQMHLKYLHYFGNESSDSLLEAYGIIPKGQQIDQLKPKQCPNCSEPNKPDSKFCAKCRMVLTYNAYNGTLEEQANKDKEVESLKQQMASMQEAQKEILCLLKDPQKLLSILKSDQ